MKQTIELIEPQMETPPETPQIPQVKRVKPYPKRKLLDICIVKDAEGKYRAGNPEGCYGEVVDVLEWALNDNYGKAHEILRRCVITLRDKYKTEISTKFLTNLIHNKQDATRKIAYLLKKADIKTNRTLRYYNTQEWHKRNTLKVEWKQTKKFKIVETPTYADETERVVTKNEMIVNALSEKPVGYQVIGRWYKAEGLLKIETPIKVGSFSAYMREKEVLFMLVPKENWTADRVVKQLDNSQAV